MNDLTWQDVLDVQIGLSEWMRSVDGRTFGAGYFRSAFRAGEWNGETTEEGALARGAMWADRVGVQTFNAEPVFIEPDMMTVVEAAISGFVPEPLVETDLITPSGLLVLPRSMWLTDPKGKRMSWRAALWYATPKGIDLVLFHDPWEARDEFDEYIRPDTPMLPTHVVPWRYGALGPGVLDPEESKGIYGPDSWHDAPTATTVHETTQQVHRQVQAIWRLLQQHLADVASMRPARPYAKRARLAKLPHEHVTIVRLRRPPQEREPGEPSIVAWTHRWIVGGHWRNQPYKSLGISRQIWISPYVKGPEALELIVPKARIFQLVR